MHDDLEETLWDSAQTLTPELIAASEPYWKLARSVALWRALPAAAPRYQARWRTIAGPKPEELDLEEARQRIRDAWDLPPVVPQWHPAGGEWARFDMSPDGIVAAIDAVATLHADDAVRGIV